MSPRRSKPHRARSPFRRRQVALVIETSNAYARGLLQGIVHYIRTHGQWSFQLMEQSRGQTPPAWLSRWKGDGIIARVENDRIARAIEASRLPTVDVSAARIVPQLPWVETNDRAIARLAVEHFLERGFTHFGFCGDARFNWSTWRAKHFREGLREAGHSCFVFGYDSTRVDRQVAAIERWLRSLPKPVAVLAAYDNRGLQVLEACHNLGLSVPDEVAVLGVDNDELLCELASPPLSSIAPDAHRAGYEAAGLLDRLMQGEKVGNECVQIDPLLLYPRQSTDVLAIDDPVVVKALRYIREHACEGLQVADILRVVPVSRRVLEARFRARLHHTPHEEIVRVRIDRVKQLLAETELTLEAIASRTGYEHAEYMSVMFRREMGTTPGRYRESFRTRRHSSAGPGRESPSVHARAAKGSGRHVRQGSMARS